MLQLSREQIQFVTKEAKHAKIMIPSDFSKMTDDEEHAIYDMCCAIEEVEATYHDPITSRGDMAADIVTAMSKDFVR